MNNRVENLWEFISKADNNEKIKLRISSKRSANDADIVRRWAVAGKGIAYKSRLDITKDLRQGRLVRILPDYHQVST